MATNEGKKAFIAVSAVEGKRVLQMDTNGKVAHNTATATNVVAGFSDLGAPADDSVGVILANSPGTVELTAAEAIAIGAKVFAGAAGKVQNKPVAAGTYRLIGIALEAAGADGDIIEVMPTSAPMTETV